MIEDMEDTQIITEVAMSKRSRGFIFLLGRVVQEDFEPRCTFEQERTDHPLKLTYPQTQNKLKFTSRNARLVVTMSAPDHSASTAPMRLLAGSSTGDQS